jgi:hypothetical protein
MFVASVVAINPAISEGSAVLYLIAVIIAPKAFGFKDVLGSPCTPARP